MITKQLLNIKRNPLLTSFTLFFILLTTFVIYSPALKAQFTNWDDDEHVVSNVHIRSLDAEHVKHMFESRMAKTFIPLTLMSYAVEYHFFGLNPRIYHVTNILLHVVVIILIFYFSLMLGMNRSVALLAAFLFAIHPMHVESVAWISERKDVLCAVFYLGALLCYWCYLEANTRRWLWYGASIVLGVFSMLAKPMAFSLPLILWLLDWWKKRPLQPSVFLDKLPHFFYILIFSWFTLSINVTNKGYGLYETILIWLWAFTFYLKKFFIPLHYTVIYKIPEPIALGQSDYLLASILFILIILCLWLCRKNRILLFAFSFYVLGISMLIIRAGWKFGNLTVVADRFMYLPSLGICIFIAWFIEHLIKNTKYKIVISAGVAVLFTFLFLQTFNQVAVWKDNVSLWSHTIKINPFLSRAYINRAQGYMDQEKWDEAQQDLESALLADAEGGRNPRLYMLKGLIAFHKNDLATALDEFNLVLVIKPLDVTALINRGNIYALLKGYDLALADFNKALEINSFSPRAYFGLGNIYLRRGDYRKALDYYDKALQIDPHFEKARIKYEMIDKNLSDLEKNNAVKILP
jgi:protein O-mannosyl-transferase